MKKTKTDLVKNWLDKARRDLVTAKNSLDSSEPFADIISFHTQQAGEKYIKAYLIWKEIVFPWTHSLEDLLLLASKADSTFTMVIPDANLLTPYAVEIRYGESDEPLITDAEKVIEIAEQIRDFVLEKFPDEVKRIPKNNSNNIKNKNISI